MLSQRSLLAVALLLTVATQGAAAPVPDDAPRVLAHLEGKQLLLRTPASERELHFDAAGQLVSPAPATSPLASGVVRVRDIRLHATALEIYGDRVAVATGNKILTVVLPYPVLIHAALPRDSHGPELETAGAEGGETVLRAIVDRLFFPEQETTSRLLAYWRRTISGKRELKAAQRAEQPIGVLDGARPVYLPDPPRITPPRATYQPGPLYNDEVRRQGMSGQVIVNVIVNERGDTEALEIEKSAGETMDSATIQKLSQWRFAPGHRRGVPVAAILRVKVNFSIVPPKTH